MEVKSFQFFCFLASGSIHSILGWRPYRIAYLNYTIYSLIENIEANGTFNENDETDTYVNLKTNAPHPFVKVEFYVDSGKGLFDMKVVNETFDICRFFRDKKYLKVIQVIYKNFAEQTNFPSFCPIKKNLYVGKNVKIDVEKLPPTLPNKNLYIALTFMSKRGSKLIPVLVCKSITQIKNI